MKSIRFDFPEDEQALYLVYHPDPFMGDFESIIIKARSRDGLRIRNTLFISKDVVQLEEDDIDYIRGEIRVVIGETVDGFIKINPKILMTNHTFYFSKDMELTDDLFVAKRSISILKKIDIMINSDLYVGNGWEKHDGHDGIGIPEEEYRQLVKLFPTTTELNHYADYRISLILKNFYPECDHYEEIYEKYFSRKRKKNKSASTPTNILDTNLKIEYEQFKGIRDTLKELLDQSVAMDETEWQEIIQKIILLIYPQYILSVREKIIKATGYDVHDKKPDFLLVDANGFIDVLEIKKPQVQIITENPSYRHNYIPTRELSGAAMQIEKYLFYLNNMVSKDNEVCAQLKKHLSVESLELQIVSPRGLLLLGRHNTFKEQKIQDFEIIKRQYKHIADIMTYDDLLQRLDNIVAALKYRIDNEDQLE